jgi:hypothetical protein
VPLPGRTKTWEPPVEVSVPEIEALAGWIHKRFHGYDFAQTLEKSSFKVEIFKITTEEARLYAIAPDRINDDIFIAKPTLRHS